MNGMPELFAAGRRQRLVGLSLLALGQAVAAGVTALAIREAFNVMGAESAPLPWVALAAILVAGGAIAVLRWAERVAAQRLGHDYAAEVRLALFAHLASLPASEVSRRRAGTVALRFVGDLNAIRAWIGQGLARLICAAIVLPVVAAVMFVLDPRMGSAATLCALAGLVGMALPGNGLRRAHRRLRRRRARLSGDVAERLPHAPTLRRMGRLARERRRLARNSRRLIAAALHRQRRSAMLRVIPDLVQAIGAALILWIALDSDMATGDAAAALAALGLLVLPLRDLGGVWDRQAAWHTARQRCVRLLTTPGLPHSGKTRRHADSAAKAAVAVAFDKVSLGVLDAVSAVATPGRKIGITGPNGAGKSSLLMLAAGLEAPRSGRVKIDGIRCDRYTRASRHCQPFYLGTDAPVLAGSLRRALTLGLASRPPDERVLAVAAQCGLTEVIARLGGLDGRLSEGGRNLSGGELARVLVVRTLLSRAPALLLDEPEAGLDHSGRRLLATALQGLESTVLLVSHDWSILCMMDEIWFLDGGRILECGSPQSLRASAGPAAGFFDLGQTG